MASPFYSITFASLILFMAGIAEAADKNQYHLFNPTPRAEMRDLVTDRPDKTEAAYTVDAGHFQIETDLVTLTRDHFKESGENIKTRSSSLMLHNFKAGLTNDMDLQLVVESYNRMRSTNYNTNTTETAEGFGDVTTRLKYNIWGNDEGETALAIMPFIKFPTNENNLGNNDIEGGVIVPYSVALPHNLGLGLMTQINWNKDADDAGYSPEFVNTATIGIPLTDSLGMYTEIWTAKSTDKDADWLASFDIGFTYKMTEDLQFDAGLNTGLTKASDDYNPFLGVTYRY